VFQKKVLVTGASRGIGKSIIESFFSEDSILIGTATSEAGIKSILENFSNAGVTGKAYLLDLNEDESIKSFIENLKKDDMNPDVLINNAGITKDNLMLRMSEDDWNDVINIHLSGQFKLMKAFVRNMLKNRWGRIINISSAAAAIGNKGQANYVAAKAGIEAMSKSLAREVGIKNITVNCIAPGFIETDMTKDLDSDYIKTIQSGIPLERLGKPEEVASLVKYISSDDANYITGQTIHINGGLYM
jgi:3-oxoacyl-[acyl-carrier protein] reductase|tara:strand:- start:10663 stop:11397 length:735 start_codon:yes stop_codon:yes gene_type:complete